MWPSAKPLPRYVCGVGSTHSQSSNLHQAVSRSVLCWKADYLLTKFLRCIMQLLQLNYLKQTQFSFTYRLWNKEYCLCPGSGSEIIYISSVRSMTPTFLSATLAPTSWIYLDRGWVVTLFLICKVLKVNLRMPCYQSFWVSAVMLLWRILS